MIEREMNEDGERERGRQAVRKRGGRQKLQRQAWPCPCCPNPAITYYDSVYLLLQSIDSVSPNFTVFFNYSSSRGYRFPIPNSDNHRMAVIDTYPFAIQKILHFSSFQKNDSCLTNLLSLLFPVCFCRRWVLNCQMCCYLSSSSLLLSFSTCCYHISIRFLSYRPLHSGCVFPCFCFLHIPPSFLSSFFLSASFLHFLFHYISPSSTHFRFSSKFHISVSQPRCQLPDHLLPFSAFPFYVPLPPALIPHFLSQFVAFRHLRLYLVFPNFDQS